MTEVSRHFGTGAEVSYGHFSTRQSEYLQRRPTTSHIISIGKYLFKLQLKSRGYFFETHCITVHEIVRRLNGILATQWG